MNMFKNNTTKLYSPLTISYHINSNEQVFLKEKCVTRKGRDGAGGMGQGGGYNLHKDRTLFARMVLFYDLQNHIHMTSLKLRILHKETCNGSTISSKKEIKEINITTL